MSALEDVPKPVYRTIVAGIALYFGLLIVGVLIGSPVLLTVAQLLFGIIAVGLGALLFVRPETASPLVTIAATALVLGGVAQFFWLATGDPLFDRLGSALVFVGIGSYLLSVLRAD